MKRLLFLVAIALPLTAAVKVPPIFSDHMVLQSSQQTAFWGTALAHQKVQIQIAGQSTECVAGDDGAWRAELDLSRAARGPWVLTITGDTAVKIDDVVLGDVWLCSGQSNMGWLLKDTAAIADEVRLPRNPWLRQFTVDKRASLSPLREIGGHWMVAQAATVPAFSAVAYYFGKTLQERTGNAIGLVHSSWGGTPIESWMSREAIAQDPELQARAEESIREYERLPARKSQYLAALDSFETQFERRDRPAAAIAEFTGDHRDGPAWGKIKLPGAYHPAAGESAAGALWIRKSIMVEKPAGTGGLSLYLGAPSGFESVYWNGVKIGEMTPAKLTGSAMPRIYSVPGRLIHVGSNVLAVRLFVPAGVPGLSARPGEFRFSTLCPLEGDWDYRWEYQFPAQENAVDRWTKLLPAFVPEIQQIPTSLYNAKINPLIGYALKGVAWYQGEANGGDGPRYRVDFPLLIEDWRAKWRQPDLPFLFCQLANFKEKTNRPGESGLASLREAQADALRLPHTGMAVLFDLGEVDVHFRVHKNEAGRRLALTALRTVYGQDVVAAAPTVIEKNVRDGTVRLRFDAKPGDLVAHDVPATYMVASSAGITSPLVRNSPGSQLEGFQICGAAGIWEWADARIDGSDVVVSSPRVRSPTEVRYAWADNPTGNLYCAAGLPIAPFRTDAPVDRDQRMGWWREARFGMFIHWGIYSVPAGIWQGKPVPGIGEWIMNRGQIPVKDYAQFAALFNPTAFDAETWVKAAKNAGMKYIVITAKHHDGFALFKSAASPYNIFDATPFGRDPLAELAAACRREGIKLGFYYSQAQDWHQPGGAVRERPHWDPAQNGDMDEYLKKIAVPQVRELLSNYGPVSVLWWDTPQDMTPARAAPLAALLKLQPNIITNNRLGGGDLGDTDTPEQKIPAAGYPRDWETCMTMNDTWGFKSNDQNWKSAQQLVRNLVDTASKGGNFLLNIGPQSDGRMPAASLERLQQIGSWLARNGESIYGTTAGPFRRLEWGRATKKGDTLYLNVFDWPKNGWLVVPMRHPVARATVLQAPDQPLAMRSGPDGLRIHLPSAPPDPISTVVVLNGVGAIDPLPEPPIRVSADKPLQLDLDQAQVTGSIRVESDVIVLNTLDTAHWRAPSDSIRWRVRFIAPGRYQVTLKYAIPPTGGGNGYVVTVGSHSIPGKTLSTKGTYQGEVLGPVEIERPGDAEVAIQSAQDLDQNLMNLTSVELKRLDSKQP